MWFWGHAQDIFEVKELCMAAPDRNGVAQFVRFVDVGLGTNRINTPILRVDLNYVYRSRPVLRGTAEHSPGKFIGAPELGGKNQLKS